MPPSSYNPIQERLGLAQVEKLRHRTGKWHIKYLFGEITRVAVDGLATKAKYLIL